MKTESLFDKISELKEKFKNFFQHKKKVTALDNFSVDMRFAHTSYVLLIKDCMKQGFLDQEESSFLDHMLGKYEINYLDWAHKTKWLKNEMKFRGEEKQKNRPAQQFFNFERAIPQVNVPVELLLPKVAQIGQRK